MTYEKEYVLAQRITKNYGNFAAREQKKGIKKELKEDQSFVTETDIIVEEAGGIVTKPDGSPFDIFQRKDGKWCVELLTAANAALHQRMVELLTDNTAKYK